MDRVTGDQCKEVVRRRGCILIGHHYCALCGGMTSYRFVFEDMKNPKRPDADIQPFYDSSCHCGESSGWQPMTWDEFAGEFNMQTPASRAAMWQRFETGEPLFEVAAEKTRDVRGLQS